MVSTINVSRHKRQAMVTALALFVLALLTLSGNASLTPATAAPNSQTSAQPTPTARPILLTDPVPDPKQAGVQYFPQTGHTLRGAFLDYWNRYGGLAQFGYPLTEEFFEPVGADNKLYRVQYFERNRFELHPENKGTQFEVLLGVLGRDFRQQDPPATPIAGATYFKEIGHNLSGAFKQYWDMYGGLFVHGFPITEPQQEKNPIDGKTYLVQYFERSRFELPPENAGSPYEVLLGVLGRQLSEKKGYPYGWYPPYGRAADWSWVAGHYYFDPFYCESCHCDTIHYGQFKFRGRDLTKGTNIRPIGPAWTPPSQFALIVVFGSPKSLDEIANEPERSETCEKPAYIVTSVWRNPVGQP